MFQRRFSLNICRRAFTIALCLAASPWASGTRATAQQLSIRHYDVSNGLAHSHVSAIRQDAKGYLWLATWEGLSRFDGYRFNNYDRRDGLGDPIVNAITEDRTGHLWVGTNGGGVARLVDDPHSPSLQETDVSTPRATIDQETGHSARTVALEFDGGKVGVWRAEFFPPEPLERDGSAPPVLHL